MLEEMTYQKRYSKKAKHLQIKISYKGLEVIIPQRKKLSEEDIVNFLTSKQSWIHKNWVKYFTVPMEAAALKIPAFVHLKAVNQLWEVKCIETSAKSVQLSSNLAQQIHFIGNINDQKKCVHKLQRWLTQHAAPILHEQLISLSHQTGLFFKQLSIRNNLTRWGSCNRDKNISLCCKLLFLEPHLLRHVMLHELCHTKVMSHNRLFWRLLTQHDPDARTHAKELSHAIRDIPSWIRTRVNQ